ncbi:MAG: UDP-N-acetylglucosamine 2-epimerase (non-hydrolyzing) [Candidatus Eisenbacteria bacterium]|uniref:UDP-N-acetylglucosamine 2-epimerase (Non-hydrolyzing) n=1 Tax=Eiseniibacteriota bacterium TaxID=2212470 RepID=A0A9D6L563_UNCEI|nr:UDP-N-acetylglucosamine 2-epimerase (non-hydrolyzing) [Candidatus Eisenbacteria bacterium]MBI3538831.1 UDP-N-acetylglucosamine 2-epimerase (non-hydrolyzing) [Candidatus Eisenbacteria bacterium]
MKIAVVVGTRPEIIKMAPIVRACEARGVECLLLHTGQHYSFEMDGVFFRELELPAPRHNLEVGSGSQAYQIATIVRGMEPILTEERPDVVLVEGDTNSVLASGLAAHKLGIRVGHVEAGLRSYDRGMPEEINRILTDHLSDYLFAPTEHSRTILRGEGVSDTRIFVTGNTVVDEVLRQRQRARALPGLAGRFDVKPGAYILATVHRAENVENETRLRGIFTGLAESGRTLGMPVLAALHPRTSQKLDRLGVSLDGVVRRLPPLGYLEFLGLHADAALVLTDSGGLQEEACCLKVPCVTLRDNTERPESVAVGANVLAGADPATIVANARAMRDKPRDWPNPFGDGKSGERIVDLLIGRAGQPASG